MSDTPILDLEQPLRARRQFSVLRFFMWLIIALSVIALASWLRDAQVGVIQAIYRGADWWSQPWRDAPPVGLIGMPLFVLCWTAMVGVHEAGHLAGALLVGWKPLSIQAAGFSVDRVRGKVKTRCSWRALFLGFASAAPASAVRFSRKLRCFVLAGPAANLVAAVALRSLSSFTNGYTRGVLVECATLSMLMGLLNVIPARYAQAETDGYVAFRGLRSPLWLQTRVAAALITNAVRNGTPIDECNRRWFSKTKPTGKPYLQQLPGTLQHYARSYYEEHYAFAAEMLERALTVAARGGPKIEALVFWLAAAFQAEVRRNLEHAITWKSRIPVGWLEGYQNTCLEASLAFCSGDKERFLALREQALQEYKREPESPVRTVTIARWHEYTQRLLVRLETPHAESAVASS